MISSNLGLEASRKDEREKRCSQQVEKRTGTSCRVALCFLFVF
uniref:Uncharacterized protein n=1 Tax=Anguilla anguilla TaxID=7936 RepID=A0A0E9U995_ANGAN